MAGISILFAMGLMVVVILIFLFFLLMSLLSFIFSIVSMVYSRRYIKSGGVFKFKTVKRLHTTAVVFFVFAAISVVVSTASALFDLAAYLTQASVGELMGSHIAIVQLSIVTIVLNTILIVPGIISFCWFGKAKALYLKMDGSVYLDARFVPMARNVYEGASTQNYLNGAGTESSVSASTANFPPKPEGESENAPISSDTVKLNQNELNEMICPACGQANNIKNKFCTDCGQKLHND